MASPSKEESILQLLLENSPLKEWHFREIVRQAGVTKAVASKWLRRYEKQGLVRRVKEKGKFPYRTAGQENPVYHAWKRLFALEQLYRSGLIRQLLSLKRASIVIIFGSIARGDWYKGSDIDIFILGSGKDLNRQRYERKLGRSIELHVFEDKQELQEVKTGLIKNVMDGYLVKGRMQDIVGVV